MADGWSCLVVDKRSCIPLLGFSLPSSTQTSLMFTFFPGIAVGTGLGISIRGPRGHRPCPACLWPGGACLHGDFHRERLGFFLWV